MGSAKFNLQEVRELAKCVENNWFSQTRAVNHVTYHLQLNIQEARSFILAEISSLSEDNFSHSKLINGLIYDVYGKIIKNIPWYIKFSVDRDVNGKYLTNMSFHPTEHKLETLSEVLEIYKF